jgi:hypothetical protein
MPARPSECEKRIGQADTDWPDWQAEYVVCDQTGQKLSV